MGNWVAEIMEIILPDRWQHVPRITNPANRASRDIYTSDTVQHCIWWNGPSWLHDSATNWPVLLELVDKPEPCEKKASLEEPLEVGLVVVASELPLLRENNKLDLAEACHCVGAPIHEQDAWSRMIHHCRFASTVLPLPVGNLVLLFGTMYAKRHYRILVML